MSSSPSRYALHDKVRAPDTHFQRTSQADFEREYKSSVLVRTLSSYEIFFMTLSAVVGVGFFQNFSYALEVAGPGGALIGVVVVGVIVIAVMECIGEMLSLWPVPNALAEYVRLFVDEDLSVIVGIAYWFMHCVAYASLIVGALNLLGYWGVSSAVKGILGVLVPISLFASNTIPVNIFGTLHAVTGLMKLLLLAGMVVALGVAASRGNKIFLDDGVTFNTKVASNKSTSTFIAISLAIFPFAGIETITTMSSESGNPTGSLRWPVRNIAWIITVCYLSLTLMYGIAVSWQDKSLSSYVHQVLGGLVPFPPHGAKSQEGSLSAPVVAFTKAGMEGGVLVGFFIFCAISSSGIGLYAASRALFGMARTLDSKAQWLPYRLIAWFGVAEQRTRVPWRATLASTVFFMWVIFLTISRQGDDTTFDVAQTLLNIGSTNCILVWASQCLAYIRCHYYRTKYHEWLDGEYEKFRVSSAQTHLAEFQPLVGWVGLIGCIFLVCVFNSASLWNQQKLDLKITGAYLSPLLALVSWIVIKLLKWYTDSSHQNSRFYVRMGAAGDFRSRLLRLEHMVSSVSSRTRIEDLRARELDAERKNRDRKLAMTTSPVSKKTKSTLPSQRITDNDQDRSPCELMPTTDWNRAMNEMGGALCPQYLDSDQPNRQRYVTFALFDQPNSSNSEQVSKNTPSP